MSFIGKLSPQTLRPAAKAAKTLGPERNRAPCPPSPARSLFSATFCAYIPWCRCKPAMAINGRCNKPFGPGGGTRRLHHYGVEIGSTRALKGVLLLGMVPPLSGQFHSCQ